MSAGGKRANAGRKKGVPNSDKKELIDRIHSKYPNFCPIEAMIEVAKDKEESTTIRIQANREIAKYIYPQLKAVEHSGEIGGENFIRITDVPSGSK